MTNQALTLAHLDEVELYKDTANLFLLAAIHRSVSSRNSVHIQADRIVQYMRDLQISLLQHDGLNLVVPDVNPGAQPESCTADALLLVETHTMMISNDHGHES